jgi:hypothetical protein
MDGRLGGHTRAEDQGERSDYFPAGNLDRIKDAPPNALAIVHWRDDDHERTGAPGSHLIDMSGEFWTMRRAG